MELQQPNACEFFDSSQLDQLEHVNQLRNQIKMNPIKLYFKRDLHCFATRRGLHGKLNQVPNTHTYAERQTYLDSAEKFAVIYQDA